MFNAPVAAVAIRFGFGRNIVTLSAIAARLRGVTDVELIVRAKVPKVAATGLPSPLEKRGVSGKPGVVR